MRIDSSGNLLVGTTSAATPSSTGYISTANTFGFKNRLFNGAMMIDQRNGGASVTPNNSYTLDRWQGQNSQTSKYTVQQSSTAPTGFKTSLLVTSSSAYSVGSGDYFFLNQPITWRPPIYLLRLCPQPMVRLSTVYLPLLLV